MMIHANDTYKVFADIYDLYAGRFNSDLDFYKSFCQKTDRIIEVGCGTGRVLKDFLCEGYQITGLDISQEMLDKAKTKLINWIVSGKLQLINHDLTQGMLQQKYDKALLTFYTFNYILDQPVIFLNNIYHSLSENGLLLMDLFFPNSLFDPSIENQWIEKEFTHDGTIIHIKDKRHVTNDIEHKQQIFRIAGSEIRIDTQRKYYRYGELKSILQESEFKNIEFSPGYDLQGFSSTLDESNLKSNYIVRAGK
jgi:SAM-dependent methyltransferase